MALGSTLQTQICIFLWRGQGRRVLGELVTGGRSLGAQGSSSLPAGLQAEQHPGLWSSCTALAGQVTSATCHL